ncbi:MAG: UDP-N-acetyl-D-glucosamine/UDP-N-acetyl-D-galactosamine dehydrogenase [Anaerophaga sp.]|uniref:nucleotide sugar dehydrogenase n=1 Tax=Anaerophaga thermohalophila TaxID=177400 RepID=UPI000237CE2A|nr:nucleotide sugar dehydrogenase [Anaerophaga thermohalophila]MDK2841058.1 UDP-N-acetyl-D-glucosamine/UDP-N-acetyl-D-galactosamine dehydrogenase [Anaerophaga sp.]MDN5291643.1 UDP-N-acetyl-D-glucosamine/UDP-N-acetyl-D-galactosamine dehydrogenase [Anaerophaga sp.]
MFNELINKEAKLSVIGLGYVGLPIALEFARKMRVIGFDIKPSRIEKMKQHVDPSNELEAADFEGCDIEFTSNPEDLRKARFHVVAVPTPINKHNLPNLNPLLSASRTVGKALKKGDCVVFESTVYPGCTEEDCVPILEQESGLKFNKDFKVGYSPERINPGDKEHTLTKILKIVSGSDDETLELIASVYGLIIKAGIHKASSIKVAEAAKIIENTQRDVNIALMNELSLIFNRLGINTYEVLEAAGTKWNFLRFFPGLVGGHCIGVDPYYLTYKANELGYHSKIITGGRVINDAMGPYVAKQVVKKLISKGHKINGSNVLIMGATFKENVSDIRNSKVADVYHELKSFSVNVDVADPHASSEELMEEYGYGLVDKIDKKYDAVILAVNHDEYMNLDESYFKSITSEDPLFVDVKGVFRGKIREMTYWSL